MTGWLILLTTVQEVEEFNKLNYSIIRNNIDKRNKQSNAYLEQQLVGFENQLLKTIIHRSESINKSYIYGKPLAIYALEDKANLEYQSLAQESTKLLFEPALIEVDDKTFFFKKFLLKIYFLNYTF